MSRVTRPITLLIAEDDIEDRMLLKEAFAASRLVNNIRFVEDGEELMSYLNHTGKYVNPTDSPRPGLILLDLSMPKKDGRECLKEIKSDNELKDIPVVVLTTSQTEEDIVRSYDLGVNSFITKPVTFDALVGIAEGLGHYWFELVELPIHHEKPK